MFSRARVFLKVQRYTAVRERRVPAHKASRICPFRCQGAWETLFHVTRMNVKMFVDYAVAGHGPTGPSNRLHRWHYDGECTAACAKHAAIAFEIMINRVAAAGKTGTGKMGLIPRDLCVLHCLCKRKDRRARTDQIRSREISNKRN